MLGELPPSPPRAFFGREDLIEKIVHLAECVTPIALIGTGGIGKTSIALATLHDDRVKQRFGENRRFIRCDEFLATHNQFLRRLSKAIGAETENPENLAALQQSLLKETLIVLDNAESILDPEGPSAREIYTDVDELARSSNICLLITSRISTIPPDCETFEVPILSIAAARDAFHRIYKHGGRSSSIDNVLEELDFHPLSITLLAIIAQQNKWSAERLVAEWGRRRTEVLGPKLSRSLAAAIELSLASPTFQELGPDAREFLEAIAFFPQGVNEENVHWQYPTIPDAPKMLDEFCVLSLTYRSDGFVTMLAPLRDHLRPKDPASSLLLGTTKECCFTRLSDVLPGNLGFEEARWIMSEDVNIEHLFDVFTTTDGNSKTVWDACDEFMTQLSWYKSRLVTLGPKIEGLPDDHPSKARCLSGLSLLFLSVGNSAESIRLQNHALKLWRGQGDDPCTAQALIRLSDANRRMGLCGEGLQQAEEASGIFERLGEPVAQAACSVMIAQLLQGDGRLEAAEETALRALDLLEKGEQSPDYDCHFVLGHIYESKGETEKAVHHFNIALGIASALNRAEGLFWVHYHLTLLSIQQGRFCDAQTHTEHVESFVANNKLRLAHTSVLHAVLWGEQNMLEEARSEALAAIDAFEKLGSVEGTELAREILRQIEAQSLVDQPSCSDSTESWFGFFTSSPFLLSLFFVCSISILLRRRMYQ